MNIRVKTMNISLTSVNIRIFHEYKDFVLFNSFMFMNIRIMFMNMSLIFMNIRLIFMIVRGQHKDIS